MTTSKSKTTRNKPEFPMGAEMPADAKAFVEKTVDQAQAAAEKASEFAHGNVQVFDASANAFKNNAAELQLKAIEFAQANLNDVFALSRQLLSTDKPETAIEAGKTYVENFGKTLVDQATELNALTVKLAQETAKPVQDIANKSVADFKKDFSA